MAFQTDVVRDALEKDPKDRTQDDLDILLRFTQEMPSNAFKNKQFTMGVMKAFCEGNIFSNEIGLQNTKTILIVEFHEIKMIYHLKLL